MLKAFEQEQWELFDAPAKNVVTKFWMDLGYECIEKYNDYGIDLLVKGTGKEFGCEVEVKLGWHGPGLNFPTLQICSRKKKFMSPPSMFIVINNSLTHGAVVGSKLVLQSPIIEVKNMTVQDGQRFFDIPAENINVINLLAVK